MSDITECKSNVLKIMKGDYKGASIRSRMRPMKREEEASKVFEIMERLHDRRSTIESLEVLEITLHTRT